MLLLDDPRTRRTSKDFSAPPQTFPSAILNPLLAQAFDYWMQIRNGEIPRKSELSPAGMIRFLKNMIIWDHDPSKSAFTCRLAGTHICEAAGRELKGLPLEEVRREDALTVRRNFEWVIGTGHVNFVRRHMSLVDRSRRRYERLLMPLTDEAGQTRHLMAVLTFVDED